jgi:hypothetical protein
MKELETTFTGRGEVKGFTFNQIKKNDHAYIYLVDAGKDKYFEVFERKENTQFDNVSYPGSKSFGISAWTTTSLKDAVQKFNEITQNVQNRLKTGKNSIKSENKQSDTIIPLN